VSHVILSEAKEPKAYFGSFGPYSVWLTGQNFTCACPISVPRRTPGCPIFRDT